MYFYKFAGDARLYWMTDNQVKDPYLVFQNGISHWLHKTDDNIIDKYWSASWSVG